LASEGTSTSSSAASSNDESRLLFRDLPLDLLGAKRRADLEEEAMRRAKLSLLPGLVPTQSCEIRELDADDWLERFRQGDPGEDLPEQRAVSLGCRDRLGGGPLCERGISGAELRFSQ